MSDDIQFTAFLGDMEHTFKLTSKLILELEHLAECGIGALFKRLTSNEFRHLDIAQTIRLGLIGGGMSPEQSVRFVETYVIDRPLKEIYPVALGILETLYFGKQKEEATE
ncbi:gene transfer agent family protein [Beijerinckia mobilis]|uniref:gene transfer agent family protein n=1 Tax=Beijerinckia mobilis TaxID=231434 RepID=UPI00054E1FC2|nr:gene transfer agent family protein [Beijerinckia mobilis]